MTNIEDVRENPVELGQETLTYHWSKIQSPRLSDIGIDIFDTDNEIRLTQKVNINGETSKVHPLRPALIIYDLLFLRYKLLEVIAPIICNWKYEVNQRYTEDEVTGEDTSAIKLEDLSELIAIELKAAIHSSVKIHDEAVVLCEEMGLTLPYTSKSLLRSFKQDVMREYQFKARSPKE